MNPIEFHPDAEHEAREAAAYYESMRPGFGDAFQGELAATLARIQAHPQLYAAEAGGGRFAPLSRFPYSVIYEELADRIWVAAVAHDRRRPGYWTRRRPN